MIQYDSRLWFSFLFDFRAGQIRRLLPSMLVMAAFTAVVCYLDFVKGLYKIEIPLTVHTLMGVVLGLVLVFRTNTAYERWWEGRKLLGAMVNSSRNLALKIHAATSSEEERRFWARHLCAFVLMIPKHLRDERLEDAILLVDEARQDAVRQAAHKPLGAMKLLTQRLCELRRDDKIGLEEFLTLSQNLNELVDELGGMERIKKTPIPFSYALLIKRFIAAYVLTLPFGLAHSFGWASVVIVPFVFYVMVGIEVIAESIENPFGTDKDDLPTDDIAQNISRNVREILSSAYGESVHETIEGEAFQKIADPRDSRND